MPKPVQLSAPVYFAAVAFVTFLGIAATMALRPAFGHSVRHWLSAESQAQASPGSFYSARVAPLLDEHCVSCHGAKRQKGQLRLDSFAALVRGGKHGMVVRAGRAAESELFRRISLAQTDEKVMPPDGAPLAADELTVINLWLAAGASGTQPVSAIQGVPKAPIKIDFEEIDDAAVARARAGLAAEVRRLQARYPGAVEYVSRGSADLQINVVRRGAKFGDAELAELGSVLGRVVWADFSGSALTEKSATQLASMRSLRVIRLMNTAVNDRTIEALATIENLNSLNVIGTSVTERSLAPLRARGIAIYDGRDAH